MGQFLRTNNIQLHFIDHGGQGPGLLLLHGLTANAHAFDGYIGAGLTQHFHLYTADLRGRGQSDKPEKGYTMADHARDIIGLIGHLEAGPILLGGHSFGALLSIFIAAHYPERVDKLILIDAAARMHPQVKELVGPSMLRLGRRWPSFEDYLSGIKAAPYLEGRWHPDMEGYYRADVYDLPDGGVTTHSTLPPIQQAIDGALALGEEWLRLIRSARQPALLLNATGPYGPPDAPAILPRELALETVEMMPDCRYVEVPGNHVTMLYGQGAEESVRAIVAFV
ncbi:MAG: alpha/beta fold hydrolase [Phaeodactylibacter sp.]|nr:alpha/beta fold hydrolase [Phaeodactylibacter sp.]MCB9053932.1 alpha/beta fold hydrolase [Lewinellaceae bacterium]